MKFLENPAKYFNGISKFINKQVEKLEKNIENFVIDKMIKPLNGQISGLNTLIKDFVAGINAQLEKLKNIPLIGDKIKTITAPELPLINESIIKDKVSLGRVPLVDDNFLGGGFGSKEEASKEETSSQSFANTSTVAGEFGPGTHGKGMPSNPGVKPQETLMGEGAIGGGGGMGRGGNNQQAFLDTISYAEGTPSYGTIYGGAVVPELAAGEMTVGEVMEMQKTGKYKGRDVGYKRDSLDSDATGRYQFMSYVLKEEVEKQKIPLSAKFTPELQDKMILSRLRTQRGITQEMIETEGMSDKMIDRLAPEFASFPNLFGPDKQGRVGTNSSYYGQGGKSKSEIMKKYTENLQKSEFKQPSSALPLQPSDNTNEMDTNQWWDPLKIIPDNWFSGANVRQDIKPPLSATSVSVIGGLGGGETPSVNTSTAGASQSRIVAFSASDPTNTSILAAKSVYRVVG